MNLKSIRTDATDELGQLFEGFRRGGDREELLHVYRRLSHDFVAVAVTTLLLDGEVRFFQLNLTRLAENGMRLLRLFRSRSLELPPASENLPLVSALVVGDFARAEAIAAVSRTTIADQEYEGELLWARALQLLSASQWDVAGITGALDALAAADEDYEDRVAAARALVPREGSAFADAFAAAHRAFAKDTEEKAASFTTPARAFAPFRFIWLEGLALLRLADRAGIPVDEDFRYCPRLARLPMTVKYEGDWVVDAGAA